MSIAIAVVLIIVVAKYPRVIAGVAVGQFTRYKGIIGLLVPSQDSFIFHLLVCAKVRFYHKHQTCHNYKNTKGYNCLYKYIQNIMELQSCIIHNVAPVITMTTIAISKDLCIFN